MGTVAVTGNYLRARGEYQAAKSPTRRRGELPPRTRRIRRLDAKKTPIGGTTSAHAENTGSTNNGTLKAWNYLRARGEYPK